MRRRPKLLFVFGTRPEAIKLAPVILAAAEERRFRPVVCSTGQHREMLGQALSLFGIRPKHDLSIMGKDQTLARSMARILERLDRVLREEAPDLVVVQGDTTSTLAGGLAAFYRKIPVAHVEAGLRTRDQRNPFPEEIHRRLVAPVADYHLAPTRSARANLVAEGIAPGRIAVTGNTAVDALLRARDLLAADAPLRNRLERRFPFAAEGRTLILVTGHRRESFGEGLRGICRAVRRIAASNPAADLVYPVHLNPNIRGPVREILSGIPNVHLLDPLGYGEFVFLMTRARLILTDSGGIQEEAPSLKKPVLLMRRNTERPEALEAGSVLLVGTEERTIADGAQRVLADRTLYRSMVPRRNPFGDGKAAGRIVAALGRWMGT